ncbi:MAG: ACT domain-containing protein [Rhodothermales bacterium]
MLPSKDWHIIKVEYADLNTPAQIAYLKQFVEQQEDDPLILIGHDRNATCPDSDASKDLAALLNDALNEHSPAQSIQTSNLVRYTPGQTIDWELSGYTIERLLTNLSDGAVPVILGTCPGAKKLNKAKKHSNEREAAILCRLLSAKKLSILGETAGIWSADPTYVNDAFTPQHLSLQEAAELAYANSGVLHPSVLLLLQEMDITIEVRPLDDLQATGTTVSRGSRDSEQLAKGITAQSDLALIAMEGLGMVGIPGITAQAFKVLAAEAINIVLLSQASTEQSIGIVIEQNKKDTALALLEDAFSDRLTSGEISSIYAFDSVGIVTVVDDNMRYKPGLTGKMFSTLGRSGINVITIADGASESNLSAVVAGEDLHAAVQALHEAFCYGRRVAHVFMFGAGTIGGKLLKLMEQQTPYWLHELNLKISLVGLSNSRHMIWDKQGIAFEAALPELKKAEQPLDVKAILNHLISSRLDRLIVIDATASDAIAELYPELLEHNISVVTPNKRANTQSVAHYERLHAASRDHQVPYFYETTVGAGLPVISTLRDLVRSGDEILCIEGVVSGTLSFLFSSMGNGQSFAEALQNAYDKGYTEPDPRDDLSGEDVARKMLILAREAGLMIERSDIQMTPLLSDELMQMPRDQFMQEYKDHLASWKPDIALTPGQKIHFVGKIEEGRIHIGLQAIDQDSALASLHGTENMIIFKTRRYFETPLIIRGPGAGPAVTAGGVLTDLIKAAELVT